MHAFGKLKSGCQNGDKLILKFLELVTSRDVSWMKSCRLPKVTWKHENAEIKSVWKIKSWKCSYHTWNAFHTVFNSADARNNILPEFPHSPHDVQHGSGLRHWIRRHGRLGRGRCWCWPSFSYPRQRFSSFCSNSRSTVPALSPHTPRRELWMNGKWKREKQRTIKSVIWQ